MRTKYRAADTIQDSDLNLANSERKFVNIGTQERRLLKKQAHKANRRNARQYVRQYYH